MESKNTNKTFDDLIELNSFKYLKWFYARKSYI